jgi:twinkle protein
VTTEVWEWLENVRGLDAELCGRMGVRPGNHRELGEGVVFAYRVNGERSADKFRPISEKTFRWHPKDVEHRLYNLDALLDETLASQPAIITEGEIDCLSVIQAGFPRCVSVPDGWSDKADAADGAKMKPILSAEDLFRRAPSIIVAADADPTGEAFTRAIAALFEDMPVRVAVWPEGCKDANDVLRQHGTIEIVKAINSARVIDPPGGAITGFSDLPPVSERRILRLGFEPFDWGLAFEEGAMSVCTGVPGFGKSTLVRFAAHHLIRNEGIRVGALELENSIVQMRDHLARLNTGKPWTDCSDAERRTLNTDLDRSWRIAHRAPTGDVNENLDWLRKRIHTLAVRDRCKFIYIDPWNELEHMPEPGENMTTYINWATKSIRQWAERYDTHVCLIAHPKKLAPGHGIPDGYDVADSAAFANKPSLGFTVHQVEGDDPHVKIKTWKVRDMQRYKFGRGMVYRRRPQGMARE